jgi:hypothetical protein
MFPGKTQETIFIVCESFLSSCNCRKRYSHIWCGKAKIAPFVFVSTIVEYHQKPTIHMVSYRAQHHKVWFDKLTISAQGGPDSFKHACGRTFWLVSTIFLDYLSFPYALGTGTTWRIHIIRTLTRVRNELAVNVNPWIYMKIATLGMSRFVYSCWIVISLLSP